MSQNVENWMDILPPDYKEFHITCQNFDPVILAVYTEVKKLFPDVWVNFINGVRRHNWCGYRTPNCTIGAPHSAHKIGAALDLHSENLSGLRKWCMSVEGFAKGIMRVETEVATPTWVHIDTMSPNPSKWKDKTKPYVFYP
ncbi:MAG: hypothetical protein LBC75_02690 [Fibromonadaceae bacterium]|jgi:hypothetical protein|nr:hypothetical protein [Fibromonadaceae bacterium]